MTTGTSPDINPVARRWAAGLLGVPETATGGEARRAYFKKLRESDFLPAPALGHAFRILDGKTGPVEPKEEWLLEIESRLRAEIESFAAEFFALPVAQRRERWDALLSRCESVSPLLARLQALKAGLDVEIRNRPLGQSHQGSLAEQLLQSFPMPPLAQAASRQAFLRQIEESTAADRLLWGNAARYLLAEWPALAVLDQDLVRQIVKLRIRLKRLSKLHKRSQQQRQAPVAGGKKRTPWPWLMILPGVVLMIARALTPSNNTSLSVAPLPSYSLQSSPQSVLSQQPLLGDLFDPTKYDVEIEGPTPGFKPLIEGQAPSRILRFTPRPGTMIAGPNGPKANNGQPLYYGEAVLRLMGVTQDQMNLLFVRAVTTAKKRLDGAPKTPPEKVEPKPPKPAQGASTRP